MSATARCLSRKFRASFCGPFIPNVLELGDIDQNQIIPTFEKVPWVDYLEQMLTRDSTKIHFSPSLEIEERTILRGISISAVREPHSYEFYIFYKRPKKVNYLFGLFSKIDK